jgi:hypothetical protein
MIPQTKTQWDGRLGIEIVGKAKGCCVSAALDWKPQMQGQKLACRYCGGMLKTIRAGEVISHPFNGGFGRDKTEVSEPELIIGSLLFSVMKFETPEDVREWLSKHECGSPESIEDLDGHAFRVPIERVIPQSTRLIWVGGGVLAEIGVAEKDVTGAGQASMQSPGITVTSMNNGLTHPSQGPAAVNAGASPEIPNVLHGLTEISDGHQHEFHVTPYPAEDGYRVKSFTSFNNGHTHMIEGAINTDGSLDTRTAPDQAPVGGHAHAHRIVVSTSKTTQKTAPDTANLLIRPEAMDLFRDNLRKAVARAKGKVAAASV